MHFFTQTFCHCSNLLYLNLMALLPPIGCLHLIPAWFSSHGSDTTNWTCSPRGGMYCFLETKEQCKGIWYSKLHEQQTLKRHLRHTKITLLSHPLATHTHTPYTRLLGNRMFTATSTGCYQALCHLITIQYCNKAIFQPTMVVKLKATSIWSCLTLAMWSCLTLAISPRSFEWIFDNRLSVSNACNYIQSKYHLYEAPGVCATVKNALCIPFGTPRPRHVTNERHLGKQPDAILFYAFTNISRQTFPIARTTISHLQTNVHHTLNNFVIDLSGPEVLPTQIADVGSAVVPYATEQLPQQRKQPSFTGYLQTGPY